MPETALPPFDSFRLATATDLPRIATVAAAGFFWSPTFQFQRPYHADFPEDTLASYSSEYRSAIDDPAAVVLVAEDVWDPAEGEHVYASLRRSSMYSHGADARVSIIVGVCSVNLKPGSSYVGMFQAESHVDKSGVHTALGGGNRDQSPEAIQLYAEATAPAKTKYLAGLMRLSTLAVHPAYWHRGHATRLVNWCTRLADMDDAPLGVSAAPMGATLAAKAGFEERETVRVGRLAPQSSPAAWAARDVGDAELWIAIRQPSRFLSDASTTCSESPVPEAQ